MKEKNYGYYIVIDYTQPSKEFIVGGSINKRIYHYYNGTLFKVETYNPVKVKGYMKQKIYIYDKTLGTMYPKDALNVPVVQQSLGLIELSRRI